MLDAASSPIAEVERLDGETMAKISFGSEHAVRSCDSALEKRARIAQRPAKSNERGDWRNALDPRLSERLRWLIRLAASLSTDRLGAVFDEYGTRTDLDIVVSALIEDFAALGRSNSPIEDLSGRLERLYALCTKEAVTWTANEKVER